MSKLLVTGGGGFIGANFVRYWRKQKPADDITVVDALTYAGNRENLFGVEEIEFVHGDIRDYELMRKLLKERQISTLVHFAAESHVDRSIHGPEDFLQTNIIGTYRLLEAAREVWLGEGTGTPHRFHHISTDEVFGSLSKTAPAFRETNSYQPNSPYSASKAASDHLVRAWHKTYGLQVTTSNCSNNYGPYQFPEKLIPLFLINILTGRPLPIYGDGEHRRDWLHVEDHCHGICLALEKGHPGETYNIGGGEELSNLEVAEQLCMAVDWLFSEQTSLRSRFPDAPPARGLPSAVLKTFVTDRKGHDRRYAIDDSKARRELGYAPRRGFQSGLLETIEWYMGNEPWWRAVQDGSYKAWYKKL